MTLFTEPEQPRLGPMGHAESRVNWLLTSTRPEARRSRETVNHWYSTFPDLGGDVARRLRSADDTTHLQSLDELYVFQMLAQPSRTITYEEDRAGPDFRVYEAGSLVASVEVASLFDKSEWSVEDRRHNKLADELNERLDLSLGYFIDFEIDNPAGTGDPPPAQVAKWIRKRIAELPEPRVRIVDRDAAFSGFTRRYERGPVSVTVRFWPLDPDNIPSPGSLERIVATGRMNGGWVTDDDRLRDRLAEKAGGKYDLRGRPFLVVVGVHASFCDDGDFLNALYGSNAVRYVEGVSGSDRSVRVGDGLFGRPGTAAATWKNRRLSAVCRLTEPNLWELTATTTAMFDNPSPTHALPRMFEPTRQFGIVEHTTEFVRLDWLDSSGLS